MGLESATYIDDLDASNPTATNDVSQGDDHLRLIKSVLRATFPGYTAAMPAPDSTAKTADFSVVLADRNTIFHIDTSGGAVTATLPDSSGLPNFWECSFVKTTTDTNPVFIAPDSGTLISGDQMSLTKTRRCIPGHPFKATWVGDAWFIERVARDPIGHILYLNRASVPVGYEPADGTSLTSAATYPDYYAANGSALTVPDAQGRVLAGLEDSASRLTSGVSGVDGGTLGTTGGDQRAHNHTHDAAHSHNDSFSIDVSGSVSDRRVASLPSGQTGTGADTWFDRTKVANGNQTNVCQGWDGSISNDRLSSLVSISGSLSGSVSNNNLTTNNPNGSGFGGSSANVQPTLVQLAVIVVE